MFSLIITLISVVLVIVLAAAAMYYGGNVSTKSTARTAAAALISQGSQINAAGVMAASQGAGWPASSPAFGPPFLSAMPTPPRAAYADDSTATSSDWSYYLTPTPSLPARHFALKAKISEKVCMAVNKEQGVIGIPAVWDGKTAIQCFGPGVFTEPGGPLGYTFFFDPIGSTPTEDAAALTKSKTDGGSSIAGYPRLCPDMTVIPSGLCIDPDAPAAGSSGPSTGPVTPPSEFPKTCPDGSVINSGTCPVPPPAEPAGGYSSKINIYPGVLRTDGTTFAGDGFVHYCVNAPFPAADWSTTVTLDGVALSIWDAYAAGDQQCVSVSGHPPRVAGTYVVTITTGGGSNAGGSTYGSTIKFADSVGPAPILQSLLPNNGMHNRVTEVTIYGAGFVQKSAVVVNSVKMTTRFIDSNTLAVSMPTGDSFGYSGSMLNLSVVVQNPDGGLANPPLFFSFAETTTPGGGGGVDGGGGIDGGGNTGGGPPPVD